MLRTHVFSVLYKRPLNDCRQRDPVFAAFSISSAIRRPQPALSINAWTYPGAWLLAQLVTYDNREIRDNS
jgi:hypothetical protein